MFGGGNKSILCEKDKLALSGEIVVFVSFHLVMIMCLVQVIEMFDN